MREHHHFIGIGGIGMSALARIMLQRKLIVSGSDLKDTVTTQTLKELGATIYQGHQGRHIKEGMHVVYSSDISQANEEWKQAQLLGLKLSHRSECLDALMRGKKPLLIAGCHGKTSTTALLSTLLIEGGLDPSFVVGGYISHLMTNGHHGHGEYFVAEADESDGSFLRSRGWGAIVTNTDEDHITYWRSQEDLLNAYKIFIEQTERKDLLFLCGEDRFLSSLKLQAPYYGFGAECNLRITRMQQEGFFNEFDLDFEGRRYLNLRVKMQGVHQVLNTTAAVGMALRLGVSIESIKATLLNYQGVKRRLECVGEVNQIKIFDDYAHHPTEVITTLRGLKAALSDGRLIVVFQPHRYTRLQRHLIEFAQAFDQADICLITEVYSAGEEAIAGVNEETLLEKMGHINASKVSCHILIDQLLSLLKPLDTVVTLGAGDITTYGPRLLARLRERYDK